MISLHLACHISQVGHRLHREDLLIVTSFAHVGTSGNLTGIKASFMVVSGDVINLIETLF